MDVLMTAFGLVLLLEGFLYSFFPDAMRRMMAQVIDTPPHVLRRVGTFTAFVGLVIIYLVRRF